ncbi:MAG: M16 family metallopeptidase [Anaerolineae bacterium]
MNSPLPGNTYELHSLPNGLRVVVAELPEALSASCGLYLAAGSRYERAEVAGLFHFLEHMVFKGTAKRPSAEEVSGAIEGVGGYLNASTGQEATLFYAKVPYLHLELVLDVLADLVLNPLLREDDFEKEKRVILEELHRILDTPEELVHVLSQSLAWGDHPLGWEVIGTPESLEGLDLETVRQHIRQFYGPDRCVVAVAGQVRAEQAVRAVEQHLGSWQPVGERAFLEAPPWPLGPRLRVEHRNTEQAQICLVLPGLRRDHPDRYVLSMIHAILGEGMSSRLFLEIRERRGLAYNVASFGDSYQDGGTFGLYAGVNPGQALAAVKALVGEWVRLREERVSPAELERARRLLKGRLLLSLENSSVVAGWFGQQVLLQKEIRTLDEVLDILDTIDQDAIWRVAQGLIRLPWTTLTVVGPFADETPFADCLAECCDEPIGRTGPARGGTSPEV